MRGSFVLLQIFYMKFVFIDNKKLKINKLHFDI